MKFVLATANKDKEREIRAILPGVEILPRPEDIPEVEETGDTLEENACLKAAAISRATNLPAISDDTGLFVNALDGAPGVYSARYAGEHATYQDNCEKLMNALKNEVDRSASFITVACVAYPNGETKYATGEVKGSINTGMRGIDGFGYDPLFIPDESDGRTFAEMSISEKNEISHRSRAFHALAELLAG